MAIRPEGVNSHNTIVTVRATSLTNVLTLRFNKLWKLKLQTCISYRRENPRTRTIVCISVIILFAFPPLVLSASSLSLYLSLSLCVLLYSTFSLHTYFPFFFSIPPSHFTPPIFLRSVLHLLHPLLCLFLLQCLYPHTCTHINTFLHSTPHNTCNLRS